MTRVLTNNNKGRATHRIAPTVRCIALSWLPLSFSYFTSQYPLVVLPCLFSLPFLFNLPVYSLMVSLETFSLSERAVRDILLLSISLLIMLVSRAVILFHVPCGVIIVGVIVVVTDFLLKTVIKLLPISLNLTPGSLFIISFIPLPHLSTRCIL